MTIDFNIRFQNDEILLRPMQIEDIEAFSGLTSDENMWIYFTADLSKPIELEQWVKDGVDQTKTGKRLAFTIMNTQNNIVVGATSLGNISYRDSRVEIGWTWLGKPYQGMGINDAVKRLLLAYCFDQLEFERVELKTDVLNIAARKALLRVGFTEEGVLRSHTLMTHGRRRDTIYYSMLRNEWNKLKVASK